MPTLVPLSSQHIINVRTKNCRRKVRSPRRRGGKTNPEALWYCEAQSCLPFIYGSRQPSRLPASFAWHKSDLCSRTICKLEPQQSTSFLFLQYTTFLISSGFGALSTAATQRQQQCARWCSSSGRGRYGANPPARPVLRAITTHS